MVEVSIECRRMSRQAPVKGLFSQIHFVLPPGVTSRGGDCEGHSEKFRAGKVH